MRKKELRRANHSSKPLRQRFLPRHTKDDLIKKKKEFELVHSSELGNTSYLEFLRQHELTDENHLPSRLNEQRRFQTYDRWLNLAIIGTVCLIIVLIVVAFFI